MCSLLEIYVVSQIVTKVTLSFFLCLEQHNLLYFKGMQLGDLFERVEFTLLIVHMIYLRKWKMTHPNI